MSEEAYYHIRITPKSDRGHDEVKLDLTKEILCKRFIEPYEYGKPITINGRTIENPDIERINVNITNLPSSKLLPTIRARRRDRTSFTPGISDEWYVTKEGKNVTDDFILGHAGYRKDLNPIVKAQDDIEDIVDNRVFIVHGHDEEMKQSVARTIEKLGLEPIILHEKPNKGKTIIEKFEKHSSNASLAVILLSPDDIGSTADTFPDVTEFRARQNVILELGYFIGKLGRESVFVLFKEKDDFDLPSDILGILYTPYKDGWELKLVKEMKAHGYEVNANNLI